MYNKPGDKMKIYIELIYILNFLLDFMILYGTKRLLKISKDIKRQIYASILGSITTIFLEIKISNLQLFIIKVIISILMIVSAFGKNNFFKNTLYFYMITIILGGVIYLFDLKTTFYINMIFISMIFPVVIYIVVKELSNYKLNIQDKYIVTISYKNKKYQLEGFIDTGNKLKSPISNKSVILVNLKINTDNIIYIPYKALNTEGIIPCIKPDKVIINNKVINNCLIGLSKDKFQIEGYNCILPNKLKEDLC